MAATITLWVRSIVPKYSTTSFFANANPDGFNYSVNQVTNYMKSDRENLLTKVLPYPGTEEVWKVVLTVSGSLRADGLQIGYGAYLTLGLGTDSAKVVVAASRDAVLAVTANQCNGYEGMPETAALVNNAPTFISMLLAAGAYALTAPPTALTISGDGSRSILAGDDYAYQYQLYDVNNNITSFAVQNAPAWLQWDNTGKVWGTTQTGENARYVCTPVVTSGTGYSTVGAPFTLDVITPAYKMQKALEEAYASVPENLVVYTLEFLHPAFKDDSGNPMSLRIVRDAENLTAPLEVTAPLDAGKWVEFQALHFDVVPPAEDGSGAQYIEMSIDNVSRELLPFLEIAATGTDIAEVIIRPYLKNNPEDGCQMPIPPRLIVATVSVSQTQVKATARMEDIANRLFLNDVIDTERFPSLGG